MKLHLLLHRPGSREHAERVTQAVELARAIANWERANRDTWEQLYEQRLTSREGVREHQATERMAAAVQQFLSGSFRRPNNELTDINVNTLAMALSDAQCRLGCDYPKITAQSMLRAVARINHLGHAGH